MGLSPERKPRHTASKGELTKINVEGCRNCGNVYVSDYNAARLRVMAGWHPLSSLQQEHPGNQGLDVVIRVRGRVWGKTLGSRLCPDCAAKKPNNA